MNTDKRVFFLGFRSGVAEDSVLVEELAWNVGNRLPNYATSYLRTESPSIASAVQTNDLSRGATPQNNNAITQNAGKHQYVAVVSSGNFWTSHPIVWAAEATLRRSPIPQ